MASTTTERIIRFFERVTRTDLSYVLRSGFWGNLGTLSVTLFSLLLYLVFARELSKETFGTYQYLLSLGALLGALTFTGMNTAVIRAVARGNDGTYLRAVRFQLGFTWVPIIASVLGSAYYASQGNNVLALGLLIVGIGTPLINAWNTYAAFLVGKKDFKRLFFYNFSMNVPFYALLIGAAFLTDSPVVLILINISVQAIGYYLAYRKTQEVYDISNIEERGTLSDGAHLSVMGALATVAAQVDQVLAFHFLGAAGLAVYAFATAIPERLGGLFKFLPHAALSKFATRTPDDVRANLTRRILLSLPLLLVSAGVYAFLAPVIFSVLFPAYMDAVPYSQLYAFSIGSVLTQVLLSALQAHARIQRLYIATTISPILQCVLQLIGVITFGLLGLIIGRLLGLLASFFVSLTLVLLPDREASSL